MKTDNLNIKSLNWDKVNGLIPAIIQDYSSLQVLMMGYMNKEALQLTLETRHVTFYSRTKKRLWTKGETSGNYLQFVNAQPDCDCDTLLIQANPIGLSCHLNNPSCFGKFESPDLIILSKLESVIKQRFQERSENSYVSRLFNEGIYRIAQKVGEESIEVALASISQIQENIRSEAADLIFHLLVLLRQCQIDLAEVMSELNRRT